MFLRCANACLQVKIHEADFWDPVRVSCAVKTKKLWNPKLGLMCFYHVSGVDGHLNVSSWFRNERSHIKPTDCLTEEPQRCWKYTSISQNRIAIFGSSFPTSMQISHTHCLSATFIKCSFLLSWFLLADLVFIFILPVCCGIEISITHPNINVTKNTPSMQDRQVLSPPSLVFPPQIIGTKGNTMQVLDCWPGEGRATGGGPAPRFMFSKDLPTFLFILWQARSAGVVGGNLKAKMCFSLVHFPRNNFSFSRWR